MLLCIVHTVMMAVQTTHHIPHANWRHDLGMPDEMHVPLAQTIPYEMLLLVPARGERIREDDHHHLKVNLHHNPM